MEDEKKYEYREDPHYWLGYFSNMLEAEALKHPDNQYYLQTLEEWQQFHPRMLAKIKAQAIEDYKVWRKAF